MRLMANSEELTAKLADLEALEKQIHGLESELIETKLELAIKSSDSLVIFDANCSKKMPSSETSTKRTDCSMKKCKKCQSSAAALIPTATQKTGLTTQTQTISTRWKLAALSA